jgi:hypothetical protein
LPVSHPLADSPDPPMVKTGIFVLLIFFSRYILLCR